MMRVEHDMATIEIEDEGDLASIEVTLDLKKVTRLPKHKITFPTLQK